MSQFNVMSGGRTQVLVDEQQLQQLQAELTRRGLELERLKASMETLSAVNTPAHFVAAAMSLCNEMASRWNAERVGIGFLKGRYVRLVALSHTERITRHMQLVQDIEAAMEECLDQDVEVLVPPPKEASFVYRATEMLALRHGPNSVISLPLRRPRANRKERYDERYGNVVAVLTMERKSDKPLSLQEIETLRLTCDLFTARLVDLYENDRWIGAKALRGTRRTLAWAVGAKHTWGKLAAIAASGFIAFAVLVDGTFHVEAPFTTQALVEREVDAPFLGTLKRVEVKNNDLVFRPETAAAFEQLNALSPLAPLISVKVPSSVLAVMDTHEQEKDRDYYESEMRTALKQADIARADQGKTNEEQIAVLKAEGARLQMQKAQLEIDRGTITAPIDGVVFSEDIKSREGTHVQQGEKLFQVGQRAIRAELSVSEDQITEVHADQKGVLKATSYPDRPVHFTVDHVFPVATTASGKNVFKVRVELDPKDSAWLVASGGGVEGLAKIEVRPEKYAWIWTHRMINWVRMKLWM